MKIRYIFNGYCDLDVNDFIESVSDVVHDLAKKRAVERVGELETVNVLVDDHEHAIQQVKDHLNTSPHWSV